MTEEWFDTLLEIGHEIAGLEGAGDTGVGMGQYEVFIERGGTEYQVTVEPRIARETDEAIDPLGDAAEIIVALLDTYAELHAKYDLGDCQATADAREFLETLFGPDDPHERIAFKHMVRDACRAASVDRSPEGQDGETRLDAKHESAGPKDDAQQVQP